MSKLLCSFFFIVLFFSETIGHAKDEPDESLQFDQLLKQGQNLAALFTQECCTCTDCVEAEALLGSMSKELEDNLDLLVVKLKSKEMKKRFGIKRLPTLIYIRENKYAIYGGQFEFDSLYEWLQLNKSPATVDLNDVTFEHLTQAATGATTGDWLVIFHDGSCCKNRELIHLETVGTSLKNKVNVASVNILDAPETKKRFNIRTCPQIIFFRLQKMYRFSLSDVTSKTLKSYVEGFYKNSKAEPVPLPPSLFDKILEKTIEFSIENPILVGFTTTCTFILLIFAMMYSGSHKKSD